MKMTTKNLVRMGLAAFAIGMVHGVQAQVTIGSDDFDTSVTGVDYISRVFSPDNSNANGGSNTGVGGNTGFSDGGGTPLLSPTYGGSSFDLFGIARKDLPAVSDGDGGFDQFNGEPFDVFDQSLDSFPPDVLGYAPASFSDGFVVTSDTDGGGADANLDYQFDISGYSNIQVAIDWAAFGDFEGPSSSSGGTKNDRYEVFAGIDGGTQVKIMDIGITDAQDAADVKYDVQMASGTVSDIYFSPFFDSTLWDNWAAASFAPGIYQDSDGDNVTVTGFHPDDDGTGDDLVAGDGFIGEPTLGDAANQTRAYSANGFNNQQVEAYTDPLQASSNVDGFSTFTVLDNELQTILADIAGTGSTLELSLVGQLDGSLEYVIFDNIEVTGALAQLLLLGDANNDGIVDAQDVAAVELNFGNAGAADGLLLGDANDDGIVDAQDVAAVELNFGNALPASLSTTPVPEPASLALLGLGGLLVARRRRTA